MAAEGVTGKRDGSPHMENESQAIQAALDAYEAALLTWKERDAEVTTVLAGLPWEMPREEFIRQKAFEAARAIIDERYPTGEAASNAEAYAYAREILRLRTAISAADESSPSWRSVGGPQDAAEPDDTDLESQYDSAREMDLD